MAITYFFEPHLFKNIIRSSGVHDSALAIVTLAGSLAVGTAMTAAHMAFRFFDTCLYVLCCDSNDNGVAVDHQSSSTTLSVFNGSGFNVQDDDDDTDLFNGHNFDS